MVALSQLVDSGEASWTPEPPTSYGESQETYGGRMPPQDADAEQSVLGAMMLSKDAIADVNERIKGGDFYRPAHESIYDAIVELYAKGEPADPVTVVAELNRRGELARVGVLRGHPPAVVLLALAVGRRRLGGPRRLAAVDQLTQGNHPTPARTTRFRR